MGNCPLLFTSIAFRSMTFWEVFNFYDLSTFVKISNFSSLLLHLTFNKSADICAEVKILPPVAKRPIRRRGIFALRGCQQLVHCSRGEKTFESWSLLRIRWNQKIESSYRRIYTCPGFMTFSFYRSSYIIAACQTNLDIY